MIFNMIDYAVEEEESVDPTHVKPVFTYSGSKSYKEEVLASGVVNWELALLTSGTLKFTTLPVNVDVFMVGGGKPGGSGRVSYPVAFGGAGGKGGTQSTYTDLALNAGTSYAVTIGGSGAATSAFGKTASSGGGSAGGTGAVSTQAVGSTSSAGAGTQGAYAFGSSTSLYQSGRRYGAGGGGGGASGDTSNTKPTAGGNGGTTGGGKGGTAGGAAAAAGTANTGSGGGGGAAIFNGSGQYDYSTQTGANGGSGIVIIRNHRT